MVRERTKAYLAGQDAAKNLQPKSVLDETDFGAWDVASRFQWIAGWESEGGDIVRGIVVTPLQRLLEREANLLIELEDCRRKIATLK